MRVVSATVHRAARPAAPPAIRRIANIELLGLCVAMAIVLAGLWLVYEGKTHGLGDVSHQVTADAVVNLHDLRSASTLVPLLTMFDTPYVRQRVADLLYRRANTANPVLEHIGGLAAVTIPAREIQADRRLGELRSRLEQYPGRANVPVLTAADIAAIKPRLVVRTLAEFKARVGAAAIWFFAAFGLAHVIRRWRRTIGDPLLLPILALLCGVGLMSMLTLRDPQRDTLIASAAVAGVAAGCMLLTLASEVDLEASSLRRAVMPPLAGALSLAVLLLLFGTGPGTSGVRVNLFGFQPVDTIRLLAVFALAAYFASRVDVLREFSEPPTATRPWLRYAGIPRWRDVAPVLAGMSIVLVFFFLQKDLGPALVLSCVFLAIYGIARGRAGLVCAGFAAIVSGFGVAYAIGAPATVRQRVLMWMDPWNNGVAGGDQIAHAMWALSTGALWGSGPGAGTPGMIPAGHTDFVLAVVGEELGFAGLTLLVVLYAMLCWRCLRIATRAPGDYTAFVAVGVALTFVVQALVIASGLLGLFPLSGVATPFLSYGRSAMLANFFAIGVIAAIARRQGEVRKHLSAPIRVLASMLGIAAAVVLSRAAFVQVLKADEFAAAPSLSGQADGGYRFAYNPRLIGSARAIGRGTIFDRNGLPLATSNRQEIESLDTVYRAAGITLERHCTAETTRCYPLGGAAFHLLGDWTSQKNWAATNSSYAERDGDAQLKGFDDRPQVIDVGNPKTGAQERVTRRDYRELLLLARNRYGRDLPAVRALLTRDRVVRMSIDARLQARAAAALRQRIESSGHGYGAAVILDVETGEVLASVSYPWPTTRELEDPHAIVAASDEADRFFDRPRYGLYPPGSAFKLLVAGAALRTMPESQTMTFACVRLPDGRVGNYVNGATRPTRDDPMDKTPHGQVDLHRGLVVSCNAYFAQLAARLGPKALLDAAELFHIDLSDGLRRGLAQAGYGQGPVVVSPIKMARVAAAIARGGTVADLQWTTEAPADERPEQRFLSAPDAAQLSRFMREVVTSGTGRTLLSNPTAIAGKTGTAEVAGAQAHAWFVGFAPYGGRRKIAFAVLVENAGYGARTAAPIAGDLVDAARDLGFFK